MTSADLGRRSFPPAAEEFDEPDMAPRHNGDTDADPVPAPASHLLPRQAVPVDRRLLAAFAGAVALGWVIASVVAWWLWRRHVPELLARRSGQAA